MEWLEAEGESVDDAVSAALDALGVDSTEQVTVEVIREPKKGFLGLGSQLALVKVTPKPPGRRRSRRRGRGSRSSGSSGTEQRSSQKPNGSAASKDSGSRPESSPRRQQGRQASSSQRSSGKESSGKGSSSPRRSGDGSKRQSRSGSRPSSPNNRKSQEAAVADKSDNGRSGDPKATIEEQAEVAVDFLKGLVDAFGLDGQVTSEIDEDILYLDVSGDTEALVGARGVIMHSVLELTRTVVQRKTFGAPRMRLDISGYGERRREALKIYASGLAEKVKDEGGEVMLEPMNPADRKVVHDAIGEIDGVRSFSEGEDPNRSVVIAADE